MVRFQRRFCGERVDQFETGRRAVGHADRNRAIERHHGRGHELRERVVERGDALPIRCFRRARATVTGSDRRLQRVGAERPAQRLGTRERCKTAADEQMIPRAAILFEQQNRFARWTDAGARARCLNFHQRDEPVHFGFIRGEFGQHAPEPQRVFA